MLDCYQSAGIVPFSVAELEVDFAVGGSVKWLCGGPGNGWLYVRPDLIEELEPTFIGWQAHESAVRLRAGAALRAGVARFLTGTPNVPALYAATAGYDLVEEVGVERIRAQLAPPDRAVDRAGRQAGFEVRSPREPERRGGTVTVHVPDFEAVHKELGEREVICDFRPGSGIRLGPHFFTTDDELRRAIGRDRDDPRDRRAPPLARRRGAVLNGTVLNGTVLNGTVLERYGVLSGGRRVRRRRA